ncbi:hypothetical protein J6590_005370 [Homalodisca vitripennis]|nr:hypothetical protein J6590_005370 [Homalodisca vitripennis]
MKDYKGEQTGHRNIHEGNYYPPPRPPHPFLPFNKLHFGPLGHDYNIAPGNDEPLPHSGEHNQDEIEHFYKFKGPPVEIHHPCQDYQRWRNTISDNQRAGFSSFLMPITQPTDWILPEKADSVKMLPQKITIYFRLFPGGKVTAVPFYSSPDLYAVSIFSHIHIKGFTHRRKYHRTVEVPSCFMLSPSWPIHRLFRSQRTHHDQEPKMTLPLY